MSAARRLVPLLRAAATAIGEGKYEEGLISADEAIEASQNSAEAWVARAVCLSRLDRAGEADEAFGKAAVASPRSEHVHYSLAVHLYRCGRLEDAFDEVQTAVFLSPHRAENIKLRMQIAKDLGIDPNKQRKGAKPIPEEVVAAADEHSLTWLVKLEPTWTYAMWGLSLVSLIALGLMAGLFFKIYGGRPIVDAVGVIGYLGNFGGLIVGIIDVADRRRSLFWLVLFVICAVFGLTFISLPLYLAVGRRIAPPAGAV